MRGATYNQNGNHGLFYVFQSTRPVRGATDWEDSPGAQLEFQSTRPVRGATDTPSPQWQEVIISIHAPRAGRDCKAWNKWAFAM